MLIDTNILIYAINLDSSKHQAAKAFLEEFKSDLEVAHQNILESLRVLTHPKLAIVMSPNDAMEAVLGIVTGYNLIGPTHQSVILALELIKKYRVSSDKVFDCYLTATALTNGIDVIVTDNEKDFKKFKEIKIINPFK